MAQPSIKGKDLGYFQTPGMKMDVTIGVAGKWKGRVLVIRPRQHRLVHPLKLIYLVPSWEQSTIVLKIQIPTTSVFIGSHKIVNIFFSHLSFISPELLCQLCPATVLLNPSVSALFSCFCTTGLWNHAAK